MGAALVRSLEEYEQVIERGLATFVDVGNALITIRDEKLYLESHDTFEDYCKQRWFLSRPRAYQLIDAAEVVGSVSTVVDAEGEPTSPAGDVPAPKSERVARELAPLRDKPDALREAWDEAVERHGDQPTARQVREVVRERSGASDESSAPTPDIAADDEPEVVDAVVVDDSPEPSIPDPGPRVKCPSCGHMVKPSDIERRN